MNRAIVGGGGRRSIESANTAPPRADPLFIRSLDKAFRILSIFDADRPSLSLSQIAVASNLDRSAAQRFSYTLERLGYLRKDPETKRFELTTRTLDLGYHFTRSNPLVQKALPYLQHLSRETEEAVSLSVLDGTEIVYVSRFMSRHMLSTDVIVGTRLPAYCSSPGRAILSRLDVAQARAILLESHLRRFTPRTTIDLPALEAILALAAERGYAHAYDEIYPGDISFAAPVIGPGGRLDGAISISISSLHWSATDAEARFAPLLMGTAQSMSAGRRPVDRIGGA